MIRRANVLIVTQVMQQIALLASQRLAHADAHSQTKCFCAQSEWSQQLSRINRDRIADEGMAEILHPGIRPERVQDRLIAVASLPLLKTRAAARGVVVVKLTEKTPIHIIKRVFVTTKASQVEVVQKSDHHAL